MRPIKFLMCSLVLGISSGAFAGSDDSDLRAELEALKSQVKTQATEIQQLRAANGDSWLTQRRAEEVKTLIRDVLSDADTRASLAEGGMTAGWNGHFYLSSEDGNFLMQVSGVGQARYTFNRARGRPGSVITTNANGAVAAANNNATDRNVAGFSVRRAQIRFDGHLFDPKFTYAVQINVTNANNNFSPPAEDLGGGDIQIYFDHPGGPDIGAGNNSGDIYLEDAWFAYEFADGWTVKGGQFKAPFLHDEHVSGAHQVAIERAFVTDLFTVDYTQGVQLAYDGQLVGQPVRIAGMIHDGSYQSNTNYNSDTTDIALSGRIDVLLAGDWNEFEDYQAWSGKPMALKVGGAFTYEEGEGGRSTLTDTTVPGAGAPFVGVEPNTVDVFKWTIDVAAEFPDMFGLSLFGAVVGQHLDGNGEPVSATGAGAVAFPLPGIVDGADQWGVVLQASAFVIPDKMDAFIRYEYVDFDGVVFVNMRDTARSSGTTSNSLYYPISGPFDDRVHFVTVGSNYYFHGNAAKASVDLVYVLGSLPIADSGAGLQAAGDDQVSIRAQFQFMF
ncbi:MAG: hypothetical protein GC162_04795 [Planctomycetes bacterium]|nr:hypothetical protein [Planctomycetota bacterium]